MLFGIHKRPYDAQNQYLALFILFLYRKNFRRWFRLLNNYNVIFETGSGNPEPVLLQGWSKKTRWRTSMRVIGDKRRTDFDFDVVTEQSHPESRKYIPGEAPRSNQENTVMEHPNQPHETSSSWTAPLLKNTSPRLFEDGAILLRKLSLTLGNVHTWKTVEFNSGATSRDWTEGLRITNASLYQLS